MKTNKFLSIIYSCATLLLAASCEHKELCFQHPHTTQLVVEFDWSYAPDAMRNNEVGGMCLWFYPVDEEGTQTQTPTRYDLTGMKGGTIEVPIGRYQILYYNNDYEVVRFRNVNDFWLKECYTRDGNIFEPVSGNTRGYTPRATGAEDERVVITPDMMWGDHAMNLEIRNDGLSYWFVRDGETERTTIKRDEHRITLMPHEQVCHYSYEIRNVENLDGVTQMSAALTGMSGAVFCAAEQVRKEYVTLPFEANTGDETTIEGNFLTFGHYGVDDDATRADGDADDGFHKLVLYTWLKDGSKYYYTFDVTDQVDEAPDKRRVHIVIDGLSLPEPIIEGNIEVGVDDWIEVEEDITM